VLNTVTLRVADDLMATEPSESELTAANEIDPNFLMKT
jgi:hypothetical protein